MTAGPDVSVIIPAWNAEAFIHRAIETALAQTGIACELIIVDDASSDETGAAVKAAAGGDERVRFERLDENSGPAVARNKALELASGRYIAVLDADDTMAPSRLHDLVKLADETGVDIVADNMRQVIFPSTVPEDAPFLTLPDTPGPTEISLAVYMDPDTDMKFGGGLGYLKPLFRRGALERLDARYDETLRNSEDYYFVAKILAAGGRMLISPDAGYHYTVRTGSISHRLTPDLTSAILHAETEFMDVFAGKFDEAERKAARRRGKRLRNVDTFVRFVAALKKKQPIAATGIVASQPASMPHVLSELFRIAGEKSGKRLKA